MGRSLTIEVWHDEDIKLCRVLYKLHASIVYNHLLVLYVRELLCPFSAALDEEAICHLHKPSIKNCKLSPISTFDATCKATEIYNLFATRLFNAELTK